MDSHRKVNESQLEKKLIEAINKDVKTNNRNEEFEKFLTQILNEKTLLSYDVKNENNKELITYPALERAMAKGSYYTKFICKALAELNQIIPEEAIIKKIETSNDLELINSMLQSAVKSGSVVGESTLLVAMHRHIKLPDLISSIYDAMIKSKGELTEKSLDYAITNRSTYVEGLCKAFANANKPIPEESVITSINRGFYDQDALAEKVIGLAIKSGTIFTNKSLEATKIKKGLNVMIQDAIKKQESNLQSSNKLSVKK